MTTDSPVPSDLLAELREQLAKLESLRTLLGDSLTDQKRGELESQIQALVHTGGGAFVAQGVTVENGDFVGGDKWMLWVNHLHIHKPPDQVPLEALLQAYLRALAADCSSLPLGVVDPRFLQTNARRPVSLSNVYVDLDVMAPLRDEGENEGKGFFGRLARGEAGERTPLLEAVSHPEATRVVLLGDAGSGKTTFVHYLTLALAAAVAEGGKGSSSPLLPAESPLQGLLPVRLVLRQVAARCIPLDAEKGTAGMLWQALYADLTDHLGEAAAARLWPHLQQRLLQEGGLILLDGLDEVPEASRRRQCLLEAVADLAAALPAGRSRVVVTARPYAYADPTWRLPGFRTLAIAPFDDGQIARFVARWYQAVRPVMGWDADTAQDRGDRLTQALDERPYLADLASRPLLLTLMTTLHTSWGQLPEDRAELYEETVKLLLSRWQRAREVKGPDGQIVIEPGIAKALSVAEERIAAALHRLAHDAHVHQAAGAERQKIPADITAGEVLAAFAPLLPSDFNPQVLLTYLETRAGLLVGRTPGTYAFPHRSFQEYLAACHLANGQDFAARLRERVWADQDWWRAVFLLGVGKAKQGGMGNAVHVVNTLVPDGPEEVADCKTIHWQAATLAGQALLDLRFPAENRGEPQFEAVLRRVRRWLAALLETPEALAPPERAEAGDVLGRLGDPRPGVGLGSNGLPDILWCEVPAGPFPMGSGDEDEQAYDDEKPQHSVDLAAFLIGRYPITNAQYRPFVEGGGYDADRYWTPEGWSWRMGQREPDLSAFDVAKDTDLKERYAGWLAQRTKDLRFRPYYWGHPRWGLDNRPVVGLSWYEARAYCAWLAEALEESGQLRAFRDQRVETIAIRPGTIQVRLPTEAEWEKAARGDEGRRWPWEGEWIGGRANTEEAGIKETCVVGTFPAGASPYGARDMAGNVWEWTSCRWGRPSFYRPDYKYPYDAADGREEPEGPDLRVVRGGSWYFLRNARCACRDRNIPDFYNDNLGFRVVVSLASSDF